MRYDLLFNLFKLNYKLKYASSRLGLLWSIINPIVILGIFNIVFIHILKISIPEFPLFLFSGLTVWNFFSSCTVNSCYCFLRNYDMIQKIRFPYNYLLISETLLNIVIFMINLAILTFFSFSRNRFSLDPSIFYIIPALFNLIVFSYSISLLTSTMSVFSKDIPHFTEIIINIWFYATPVFYSPDMIPERLKILFLLNPIALCLKIFRKIFYSGEIIIDSTELIINTFFIIILYFIMKRFYILKKDFFAEKI